MNPLKIIRWKILLTLVVVVGAAVVFGVPATLDQAISEGIRGELMTSSETGKVSLSVLSGNLEIEKLRIDDPAGGKKPLFSADRIHADVSVLDLLRRKVVVETLVLDRPRMNISQDEEGNLNIEAKGEEKTIEEGLDPVEVARKAKEIYGTIEDAKDWVQRIRNILAHREAREEIRREQGIQQEHAGEADLPEFGPRVIIKDIKISNVDVALEGPDNPPSIRSAGLHGLELNAAPLVYGKVMGLALQGLFGSESPATFLLQTRMKPDQGDLMTLIDRVELANLDVAILDPILRETLPFRLKRGRLALQIRDGWIRNTEDMKADVSVLVQGLAIEPRPGFETLAGFPASTLCQAVSDAGTFEVLATLTGSPLSPEVSLHDSMNLLMKMGAQAFAKMALQQIESKYGASVLAGLTGKTGLALPGILSGAEGGGLSGPAGISSLLQQGGLTIPGEGGQASPLSALDAMLKSKGGEKDSLSSVNKALGGLFQKKPGTDAKQPTDPKKTPPPNPLGGLLKGLQDKKKK